MSCTGILLAAGRGRRFDPSGLQNKLMQTLPDGEQLVLRSARALAQALPDTLVVLRADADNLNALLDQAGLISTRCPDAAAGMGHSLAHAIRLRAEAIGWIVALADMPQVQSATIAALDAAIRAGADIAVPVYRNVRGNPVGFSRLHQQALLRSHGDRGARDLLHKFPVTEVAVDDPGIFFDVDLPDDLEKLRQSRF